MKKHEKYFDIFIKLSIFNKKRSFLLANGTSIGLHDKFGTRKLKVNHLFLMVLKKISSPNF